MEPLIVHSEGISVVQLQLGNKKEHNASKIILALLRYQITKVVFSLCSFIVFSDINI